MPSFHVRVISEDGATTLYMTKRYREIHDGPFSESFASRRTWVSVKGPLRVIEREQVRGPNRLYGRLTFLIIEEADPVVCRHCGKEITRDGRDWIDPDGNDCCPFGFVAVPHEPSESS